MVSGLSTGLIIKIALTRRLILIANINKVNALKIKILSLSEDHAQFCHLLLYSPKSTVGYWYLRNIFKNKHHLINL